MKVTYSIFVLDMLTFFLFVIFLHLCGLCCIQIPKVTITFYMSEVDVLENVEIGEQKRRDDAYKAAKKRPGIYDDK